MKVKTFFIKKNIYTIDDNRNNVNSIRFRKCHMDGKEVYEVMYTFINKGFFSYKYETLNDYEKIIIIHEKLKNIVTNGTFRYVSSSIEDILNFIKKTYSIDEYKAISKKINECKYNL
ncbi:hypothetical protein [Clostridium sp. Ade.TY]|uniref:hypothetical protein n=1 Tax=Clostridium sp. Ade.TY TaxID=1391647 RepID=UPI0004171981|nr:hypothetical protein [Clostridium sp. Ade.TY]